MIPFLTFPPNLTCTVTIIVQPRRRTQSSTSLGKQKIKDSRTSKQRYMGIAFFCLYNWIIIECLAESSNSKKASIKNGAYKLSTRAKQIKKQSNYYHVGAGAARDYPSLSLTILSPAPSLLSDLRHAKKGRIAWRLKPRALQNTGTNYGSTV